MQLRVPTLLSLQAFMSRYYPPWGNPNPGTSVRVSSSTQKCRPSLGVYGPSWPCQGRGHSDYSERCFETLLIKHTN